jgi:arginine:pyruvate transaminase
MRYAALSDRLAELGGARWAVHARARAMKAAGQPVLEFTIGEPDLPIPTALLDVASDAMRSGRTGYSNGRGEAGLVAALAARYSRRSGRPVGAEHVMCLPGTQTVLYLIFQVLTGPGDEVILGDPAYATYDGVIMASGAVPVPVRLKPEHGFRLRAEDVAAAVTPRSRVLFLNTPHNPTGAILSADDLAELGAVAKAHDLWIVCDEVYEELIFPGQDFASPFDMADLAERTIIASSISKSHAAPGFRSGWLVAPAGFTRRALPVAETMLFGSQPFIADMTASAVAAPSDIAPIMAARFAARSELWRTLIDGQDGLRVSRPQAGMFLLLDVRSTGLSGQAFADGLLRDEGVALMPGESFGDGLAGR